MLDPHSGSPKIWSDQIARPIAGVVSRERFLIAVQVHGQGDKPAVMVATVVIAAPVPRKRATLF